MGANRVCSLSAPPADRLMGRLECLLVGLLFRDHRRDVDPPRTTVTCVNMLSIGTQSADANRRISWMVWAAAVVSWLIGFVSIFLIAPTNSGMGIVDSYVLFQVGSNFGNVLALVFWSCTVLLAGWLLPRRAGPAWIHAFLAYGVPAVFSLFPAVVVSNAVAHVVAVDDTFVYRDWLAGPLVISGLVAITIAIVGSLWARSRMAQL